MKTSCIVFLTTAIPLMILVGCSKPSTEAGPSNGVEEGKALVSVNCLTCHSLSSDESSPRADAPSLDQILKNYNPKSLADDFREGIHVGHPDMPDFDFGAKGTDEIIAYLKSIQKTE